MLAAVLEIFGIAALLPLLGKFIGSDELTSGTINRVFDYLGMTSLSLNVLMLSVFLFMTVRTMFMFVSRYIIRRISVLLDNQLKKALMENYLKTKWLFHIKQKAGTITNIINRETEGAAQSVYTLGRCYSAIVVFSIFILTSLMVSKLVLFIVLAVSAPMFLFSKYINKLTRTASRNRIHASNELSGFTIETMSQAKSIRAGAIESQVSKRFNKIANNLAEYKLKNVLYSTITVSYPELFGIIIILFMIGITYNYANMEAGDVVFSIILMHRAYGQIASFQELRRVLVNEIPSYEIAKEMLSASRKNIETIKTKDLVTIGKGIQFKNVNFYYNDGDNVLNNLTLDIPSRGIIALVGRSGAGKTTIVDLILGLLRPSEGKVLINGLNLEDVNIHAWRQKTAYVPQDPVLFHGTIRDNILRDKPDASEEEFLNAVKLAHVDEFIDNTINGFDTVIGDRGVALSGGQRQRITLAQALIRNPQLLILDEATSALDNKSEKHINDAILELSSSMVILLIAHKFSTTRIADKIYFIKNGRVQEYGSFQELTEVKGEFYQMAQTLESV